MSEAESLALSKELYAVHNRVFAGLSESAFRKYVFLSIAESNRIRIYFNSDNETVGYCAVHIYRRQVAGKKICILRAEAGLLPPYRGQHSTYAFGIMESIRYKILHCPLSNFYYLGMLVHPSSYAFFGYFFPRMYPLPEKEIPEDTRLLMLELADSFGVPPISRRDPMIRKIGWITRDTARFGETPPTGKNEFARFFQARNPGYVDGHGLIVLIPLTLCSLFVAATTPAISPLISVWRRVVGDSQKRVRR